MIFETIQKKIEKEYAFLYSKKIVLLMHVDEALFTHRLPIARALKKIGAEVFVIAGDTGKGSSLEAEGIKFIPIPLKRNSVSIYNELKVFFRILCALKKIQPDLVHNVSIKPVLYGSSISRFQRKWACVNALSGLGYLFTKDSKAADLQKKIKPFLKFALSNPSSITILQNSSDLATLLNAGLIRKDQTTLIRGSGVDCSRFTPSPFPENPVVLLPARMLWDKGVAEFVRAAEMLHPKFPNARFVLVGPADDENPNAISRATIAEWTASRPYLEWWGAKEPCEMPDVLAKTTIVALPSYHEGLPKALLEAAACGRPIVTTDIPGCREIVNHGINGLLVPVGNADALSRAVCLLLESHAKIGSMGQKGRDIVCSDFTEEGVVLKTFDVYKTLLFNNYI